MNEVAEPKDKTPSGYAPETHAPRAEPAATGFVIAEFVYAVTRTSPAVLYSLETSPVKNDIVKLVTGSLNSTAIVLPQVLG